MSTATTGFEFGNRVTVVLSDHMASEGLADLRWYLHDLVLAGARSIVVDLSSAAKVESATLAALLGAHRVCRARGGGVVLRDPLGPVSELLLRTGLWRVLSVERSTSTSGTRRA
jgi:anti-anti-sigma regulatory factor